MDVVDPCSLVASKRIAGVRWFAGFSQAISASCQDKPHVAEAMLTRFAQADDVFCIGTFVRRRHAFPDGCHNCRLCILIMPGPPDV